ncbi:hypothetical protein [Bacillus smithii]|uniref:hypothetical protein n=1 Tax=Bacillus smithii TaxID=1479 RepID=UPI002E234D97|nr:hypothetical protein [Bacillus smithii]
MSKLHFTAMIAKLARPRSEERARRLADRQRKASEFRDHQKGGAPGSFCLGCQSVHS